MLPKITCVRNFRNSLFQKRSVFDFLGCFEKLFSAIILGVHNFRVFEILEHLPHFYFEKQMQCFAQALDSCACKAIFGYWSCQAKNRLGRHVHIKPTKTKMCMYTVGA